MSHYETFYHGEDENVKLSVELDHFTCESKRLSCKIYISDV